MEGGGLPLPAPWIETFRIFPLTLLTHKKTPAEMATFALALRYNFAICAVIILIHTRENEGKGVGGTRGVHIVCPLIKWMLECGPSTFKRDLILEGLKCF